MHIRATRDTDPQGFPKFVGRVALTAAERRAVFSLESGEPRVTISGADAIALDDGPSRGPSRGHYLVALRVAGRAGVDLGSSRRADSSWRWEVVPRDRSPVARQDRADLEDALWHRIEIGQFDDEPTEEASA